MKDFVARRAAHRSKANRDLMESSLPNPFLAAVRRLRKTIPEWNTFFETDAETMRMNWVRLEVLAQPLFDKYAWAIPNERALRILTSFSPLIEIGAGKGYWAALLRLVEVDILAYDKKVAVDCWTEVLKGGPKMLQQPEAEGRTLFLCYVSYIMYMYRYMS
ncbi:hypothetical protein B484DRAFT_284306 [Ochromonadaceae sp. CCMP2298]|nr:hypothetical protein B484DRAFT_284306 [Ochromonadaceae sp. CCMP2298]